MRTPLRIGIAAIIIIIILWIKSHLDLIQDQWEQLRGSSPALDAGIKESTGSAESSVVDSDRKANSFVDSQPEPFTPDPTPSEQTLPSATSPSTETITPGDRIIVVGKLKDEDTDWVINELPE